MKKLAILGVRGKAQIGAAERENAGSPVESGPGLQRIAAGCAARLHKTAATLRADNCRNVEAAVGALLDRELLPVGPVAADVASLEGESPMRSENRRAEYKSRRY